MLCTMNDFKKFHWNQIKILFYRVILTFRTAFHFFRRWFHFYQFFRPKIDYLSEIIVAKLFTLWIQCLSNRYVREQLLVSVSLCFPLNFDRSRIVIRSTHKIGSVHLKTFPLKSCSKFAQTKATTRNIRWKCLNKLRFI